jgi:hypothetical protein
MWLGKSFTEFRVTIDAGLNSYAWKEGGKASLKDAFQSSIRSYRKQLNDSLT